MRSLMESSPDSIMLLDADAYIVYINRTVPDLTPEQVRRTRIYDYVPADQWPSMKECFAQVAATREQGGYESIYTAADGSRSFWRSRVTPVIEGGELTGFVVFSSDVTQYRTIAHELDRFFELSLDMFCVARADGYFARVNKAFERVLGYSNGELESRPFYSFIHEDDREATSEAVARAACGLEVIDFENRYRRKDGEYRLFSWRGVGDPATGIIYAGARDITDRRALEEQLHQSQKMDAVGQLAGGVAHDFNNLIVAMLVNADFVAEATNDDKVREHVEEIRSAATRAADLTRQLLDFSRQRPLRSQSVGINELIRSLMAMLRRLIPENIELVLELAPREAFVCGDANRLHQVLVNLCLNARDASLEGGRIVIRTRLVSCEDEAVLQLEVEDDGVGMDDAVRARAFEPFFTTKDKGRGSGLGLATVYGIVVQHGGSIALHSQPGQGTRFRIALPLADAPPETASIEERSRRRGDGETILVVEDETPVRRVVVRVLERAGYRVVSAADGREALEQFETEGEQIALVLLDIVMPRMSGPQAYARMAQQRPHVRVLFTSGYRDHGEGRGDLPLGCAFLEKPYRTDALLAAVRDALGDGQIASERPESPSLATVARTAS